jgi:ABC-type Mn2+/Zn2+ transport system ATPase subunit
MTLETPSGSGPSDRPSANVIAARELGVGYADETLVAGIDLTVWAGESLALIGINGSGKSTLLKTMVGLLPSTGGNLLVFGQKPGVSRQRVAYLSQARATSFLLPLEAADVALMGCYPRRGLLRRIKPEDRTLVHAALEIMGVQHLARTPLRSLSGGQQQRVFLAQALVQQADLLVLDEPTAGLDAGGRDVYLRAMEGELARGAAVVTATHDIAEAAACTQALLLARKVVAVGPPQSVLTPDMLLETFGAHTENPCGLR